MKNGSGLRKKTLGLILFVLFVSVLMISACSDSDSDSDSDSEDNWLANTSNPMVGTWKSDPDEDGSILIFTGATDGTFVYEMQNLPEGGGYPSSGTGSYTVSYDKVLVAVFDFGLIKSIQFEVKNNDTIETKELVLVNGKKYFSSTIMNFSRQSVAETTEDQPTLLPENPFTFGNWSADIPEGDPAVIAETGMSYYPSTWEFKRDGTVVCTFIGIGALFGLETDDAPFNFTYTILGNKLVLYTESAEGNEIRIYEFADAGGGEITVTRLSLAYGGLFLTEEPDPAEPPFNLKPVSE
jgi:hypothetical protein